MKKKSIFFSLIIACFMCMTCLFTGCGADKPITISISNETELATYMSEGFKDKKDKKEVEKYVLANDITITRTDIKGSATKVYDDVISWGDTETEARESKGGVKNLVFDGQNHTIKDLTLSGFRASFLGWVTGNVTITNLTFDNLTINGFDETGAIAAHLSDSATLTLDNVKIINSSITSEEEYSVGGFIGNSNRAKGTIKNCSIENTTINGVNSTNVGGFIGSNIGIRDEYISITDSTSIGNNIQGKEAVGGFIGMFKHENEDYQADRLIEFKNLTSNSDVQATKRVGGIVGFLSYWDFANFTFTNCKTEFDDETYREIKSTTQSAGGILGSAHWNGVAARVPNGSQLNFVNCSNNMGVTGPEFVGGISGCLDDRFWKVTYTGCKNLNYGSIYGGTKLGGISGSIAGDILGAQQFSFTGCENNGFVTGSGEYVGGISGYNDNINPLFTNCTNTSQYNWITGLKYVGGISGRYGTFVNCTNVMDIKHNGEVQTTWEYVGGIVGSGDDSTFENCLNSGDIIDHSKSTGVNAVYIGGIAGFTSKLVLNGCSNSGTVSGNECVGGLVGKSDATWIEGQKNTLINCSNTGNVYAFGQTTTTVENYTDKQVKGKVGLIIGSFHTGTLIFEFSNVTVNGNIYVVNDTDYVGGWCGYMAEGGESIIEEATETSAMSYKIYLSQNISNICKSNFKYGEKVFDEIITGFNNPTSLETFTYSEE